MFVKSGFTCCRGYVTILLKTCFAGRLGERVPQQVQRRPCVPFISKADRRRGWEGKAAVLWFYYWITHFRCAHCQKAHRGIIQYMLFVEFALKR